MNLKTDCCSKGDAACRCALAAVDYYLGWGVTGVAAVACGGRLSTDTLFKQSMTWAGPTGGGGEQVFSRAPTPMPPRACRDATAGAHLCVSGVWVRRNVGL